MVACASVACASSCVWLHRVGDATYPMAGARQDDRRQGGFPPGVLRPHPGHGGQGPPLVPASCFPKPLGQHAARARRKAPKHQSTNAGPAQDKSRRPVLAGVLAGLTSLQSSLAAPISNPLFAGIASIHVYFQSATGLGPPCDLPPWRLPASNSLAQHLLDALHATGKLCELAFDSSMKWHLHQLTSANTYGDPTVLSTNQACKEVASLQLHYAVPGMLRSHFYHIPISRCYTTVAGVTCM